jgi:hypothetical protein
LILNELKQPQQEAQPQTVITATATVLSMKKILVLTWLLVVGSVGDNRSNVVDPFFFEPHPFGPNPVCEELEHAIDEMNEEDFFWSDCNPHRPSGMTIRPSKLCVVALKKANPGISLNPWELCNIKYKCRMGFAGRLYEEWDEDPFEARCKVLRTIWDRTRGQ